jgi:phosphoribosylcarboxyaminoimidazole (NCAIR) mutase
MSEAMPAVGIIMGSESDLDVMSEAAKKLDEFDVAYEIHIVSAHRTPERMAEYATGAAGKGLKVIIAGALLAIEILALNDKILAKKYSHFRANQTAEITKADKNLQESGWREYLNRS